MMVTVKSSWYCVITPTPSAARFYRFGTRLASTCRTRTARVPTVWTSARSPGQPRVKIRRNHTWLVASASASIGARVSSVLHFTEQRQLDEAVGRTHVVVFGHDIHEGHLAMVGHQRERVEHLLTGERVLGKF